LKKDDLPIEKATQSRGNIDLSFKKRRKRALQRVRNQQHFIRDILGVSLWKKQRDILDSVFNNKYTTVKASHGVGKTMSAANIALTYHLMYEHSIVVTTAPTNRQVETLIWEEIRKTLSRNRDKLPLCEIMPSAPKLYRNTEVGDRVPKWYMSGFSTTDPNKFQGLHAERLLLVVDEAAGIHDNLFEQAFANITNLENNRILLIGNPTSTSGGFYRSFKEDKYTKFTISNYDSPNFTKLGITKEDIYTGNWEEKYVHYLKSHGTIPFPFLADPKDTADKFKTWCPTGKPTNIYKSRIEGEFVDQSSDSLIPISWIELAFERWKEGNKLKGDCHLGVDVAEQGTDDSVIAVRYGDIIKKLITSAEVSVTKFAKQVGEVALAEHGYDTIIKVDTIGVGTGTESFLAETGYKTFRADVRKSPTFIDKSDPAILGVKDVTCREVISDAELQFSNLRSQMYWYLRARLDPDSITNPNPIALPPDDMLMQELSAIRYKITEDGKTHILNKREIKKELGRSPDKADAVAIAFCPIELLDKEEKPKANIRTIKY
jgi:phage terminase large subunit